MEKSTAEKLVVTQEVKTWKSRVNATTRRARSCFGSLHLLVWLTWPMISLIDNNRLRSNYGSVLLGCHCFVEAVTGQQQEN
jgi:hypothetical protein